MELIDSYIEDNPPKDNNQAIWYLGESLKKLSQADVFITIEDSWSWNGCQTEREVAGRYGIKTFLVPAHCVIDNYDDVRRKAHPVCDASEMCGMPTGC